MTHGVEEEVLRDGAFIVACYCGRQFCQLAPDERNKAYQMYRQHLPKETA